MHGVETNQCVPRIRDREYIPFTLLESDVFQCKTAHWLVVWCALMFQITYRSKIWFGTEKVLVGTRLLGFTKCQIKQDRNCISLQYVIWNIN